MSLMPRRFMSVARRATSTTPLCSAVPNHQFILYLGNYNMARLLRLSSSPRADRSHTRKADALPNTKTTTAAWRAKPTWYQVSTEDRTINPELERFLAKRMNATTIELDSSHVSLVSHEGNRGFDSACRGPQ